MNEEFKNHRGVEGANQGVIAYGRFNNSGQKDKDGDIRSISKTDGHGIASCKCIKIGNRWIEVDEIRHYARLIRKIKHVLMSKHASTENAKQSSDEEELLQILKSI